MKKALKRALAILLVATFIFSCAPAANAGWSDDENWEIVGITGTYLAKPKKYVPLDIGNVLPGAKYFEARSTDETVARIDDPESMEAYTTGEGVAVIIIDQYDKKHKFIGSEENLIVVAKKSCSGTITESYIDDVTVNYKSDAHMPEAVVTCEGNVNGYWDYYITLSGAVSVDNAGNIDTYNTGSSTVACISIATNGSAVVALSNVTVKYSFVQWLIRIFLLGFLWY